MDILLALFASFFAAFIPTGFYVVLAWWLDRYEKEPLWLLAVTFLWGALPAIVVALIIEVVLDIPLQTFVTGESADIFSAAVIAPVIEEGAKALPLLLIFWLRRHEFDGLMDGLIYGALVGFGFAMTENVFYFLGAYAEGGWDDWTILVVLRAIIFGLNHALFTSAFGLGLGYARYASSNFLRRAAPTLGLFVAILLHAVHNLFVSLPGTELFCLVSLFSDYLGVLAWLAFMWVATQQEKRWITAELAEEVATGVLPERHAEAAARYRSRLQDRWAAVREHGFGRAHQLNLLHNVAAELALKKHQFRHHGHVGDHEEVARLRAEVGRLAKEVVG